MPKAKPKPFKIFRAGTHTDSAGNTTTFTAEQLAASVKAYNEGSWRAPMVCGHPKGDAPAYGWIGDLSINEAGEIIANTEKLNPEFAQLMEDGAFRNRSASWYAPDHPSNPTPGVWQLRHLGMLGAQPPALKGLGDIEFHEFHDQEGVTVEFASADYSTSSIARLFRGLRDWMIAEFGLEKADAALSSWTVEDLEAAGRRAIEETIPNYSEPESTMTPEQIAALQAQAAKATALEASNAALVAERDAATARVTSFEEGERTRAKAVERTTVLARLQPLVTAGKLLPAALESTADFCLSLDDSADKKTFDFGDSGGDKLTSREFYIKGLEKVPSVVEYGEVSAQTENLPNNMTPSELAAQANEYQDHMAGKGVIVTTTQAVDAVRAGKHKPAA